MRSHVCGFIGPPFQAEGATTADLERVGWARVIDVGLHGSKRHRGAMRQIRRQRRGERRCVRLNFVRIEESLMVTEGVFQRPDPDPDPFPPQPRPDPFPPPTPPPFPQPVPKPDPPPTRPPIPTVCGVRHRCTM